MTRNYVDESEAFLALARFCSWYALQCNGDWEHQFGIKINTIDNPGWALDVDLEGTSYEHCSLEIQEENRTGHDWITSQIEERDGARVYVSRGGPLNLPEMIMWFVAWATKETPEDWPIAPNPYIRWAIDPDGKTEEGSINANA